MSESPNSKSDPAKPNKKNTLIWAAVVGLGTSALVFWILSSQSFTARLIAGIVAGVAVAISSYRKSAAASARSSNNPDVKSP